MLVSIMYVKSERNRCGIDLFGPENVAQSLMRWYDVAKTPDWYALPSRYLMPLSSMIIKHVFFVFLHA